MKRSHLNNKGGAEFSLLTCIVIVGLGDLCLLTALCSGWIGRGKEADRGSYAAAQAELAEEEQERQRLLEEAKLEGSAWSSATGNYYFTPENGELYFISDKTENYIQASVSVKEMGSEELIGTEGAAVLVNAKDAKYYRIDALVLQELYYGSRRGGYSYIMYMGVSGDEAYIYDSGWGEVVSAKKTEYPLQATLDDHFKEQYVTSADLWGPSGDPSVFAKEDIDFDQNENIREAWNAIEIGDSVIFKRGDDLSNALYITELNSTEEPRLLYKPDDGKVVTVFGTDGRDLIFGLGKEYTGGYTTEELMYMDMGNSHVSSLVKDNVQDFCVAGNIIYYTDYNRLVRLDKYGRTDELWAYGVYSYEVADDVVFVYDGDAWELIDADSGEDYGYVCSGLGYTYECDLCIHTEDYLFYVAYDYNRESISLRALNKWTGDERIVGGEYEGRKNDTYNVLFKDTYCYYTAQNGEKLIRVDVSTGESVSRDLSDAGWWYATELMEINGECVMHAYDTDGYEIYLSVGSELQMTEIPSLCEEREPYGE